MAKFLTEIGDVVEIDAEVIARAINLCGEFDEFRVYSNDRIIHVESTERPRCVGYVTVDATGVLDAREISDDEVVELSQAWVGDWDCRTGREWGAKSVDDFIRAVARQVTEDNAPEDVSDMPISILAPGRHVVIVSGRVGDFI